VGGPQRVNADTASILNFARRTFNFRRNVLLKENKSGVERTFSQSRSTKLLSRRNRL
jgi:hypothetical protein